MWFERQKVNSEKLRDQFPLVEACAGSLFTSPQPVDSRVPAELAINVERYIIETLNAEDWKPDAEPAVPCE